MHANKYAYTNLLCDAYTRLHDAGGSSLYIHAYPRKTQGCVGCSVGRSYELHSLDFNFTLNLNPAREASNPAAPSEQASLLESHRPLPPCCALSPANAPSACKLSMSSQDHATVGEKEKQLWLRYWRAIFGRREIKKLMVLINPFSGTKKAKVIYEEVVQKVCEPVTEVSVPSASSVACARVNEKQRMLTFVQANVCVMPLSLSVCFCMCVCVCICMSVYVSGFDSFSSELGEARPEV